MSGHFYHPIKELYAHLERQYGSSYTIELHQYISLDRLDLFAICRRCAKQFAFATPMRSLPKAAKIVMEQTPKMESWLLGHVQEHYHHMQHGCDVIDAESVTEVQETMPLASIVYLEGETE